MDGGHGNLNILHAMVEPPDTKNPDPLNNLTKYHKMMEMGHISGARAFPLIPYGNMDSGLNLTMPTQERFREIARQLDLRKDDTFVCYDSNVVHAAARLAWTLKGFGAQQVHILNGTFEKWIKDKYEHCKEYNPEKSIARERAAQGDSDYDFTLDPEVIYNFEQMKAVSESNVAGQTSIPLIDTKVSDFFAAGNIPSSKNIPFYTLLKEDLTFKSADELRELIKSEAGVEDPGNERTVVSCQIGLTASSMCAALTQLGNKKVSLYDGSYQEWSQKMKEM